MSNDAKPNPAPTKSLRFAERIAERAAQGIKSERTQARLQAAVCTLLETTLPSDLKVADICRAEGVAHGTFYVYFRDIRHILSETLTAFVGFMQVIMRRAAREGDGSDGVRRTTAAYVALFEQNAGLMRCLVTRMDDLPEAAVAFEKLNREWTDTVVMARQRRLSREDKAGLIEREELLRRAHALGGMVDQYLIMLLFGRDSTLADISRDRDAVINTLTLIWERGMEP
ncbi:MAG: TetR/AcrR family transcriptional regulator [Pseudomonadota bacterium]|nr:TetR/AcrR family transcriptional regulator [Pseudomonadota bacterium]